MLLVIHGRVTVCLFNKKNTYIPKICAQPFCFALCNQIPRDCIPPQTFRKLYIDCVYFIFSLCRSVWHHCKHHVIWFCWSSFAFPYQGNLICEWEDIPRSFELIFLWSVCLVLHQNPTITQTCTFVAVWVAVSIVQLVFTVTGFCDLLRFTKLFSVFFSPMPNQNDVVNVCVSCHTYQKTSLLSFLSAERALVRQMF